MLGAEYTYYVDHRKRSVWVPNYKVASRTIHNTIGDYVNGDLCRRPRDKVGYYIDYTWVMVIRHPFDKLRSYWEATIPPKDHESLSECVEAMLSGEWVNLHTIPQYELIRGLKIPEILIPIEELTSRHNEVVARFSWPLELSHQNKSPTNSTWQVLFQTLSTTQINGLLEYYKDDFNVFGFPTNTP